MSVLSEVVQRASNLAGEISRAGLRVCLLESGGQKSMEKSEDLNSGAVDRVHGYEEQTLLQGRCRRYFKMNNVTIIESTITPNGQMSLVQKTTAGLRNRSNIARLIGGATPGPGNIGFLNKNYSINKSQSPLNVSLIRDGGTLGPSSANFAVLPGLAQSGIDYSYLALSPFYAVDWEFSNPMGRMHSDGLYGTNGFVNDEYNHYYSGTGQRSVVSVQILNNTNSLNNLTAQFQMANPLDLDQLYLGGVDVALGNALGRSVAPFTLIDDHHQSGKFGFSSANYVGSGTSASIAVNRTNGTYGVVYLSYATTTNGSTALLNNDYLASSGTLTFQPSDTSHTFNVTILNTNSVSAVEKTVNLTLFGLNPPVNGLASLGLTNAVLRLDQPELPRVCEPEHQRVSGGLERGLGDGDGEPQRGQQGHADGAVRHDQRHGLGRHGLHGLYEHAAMEQRRYDAEDHHHSVEEQWQCGRRQAIWCGAVEPGIERHQCADTVLADGHHERGDLDQQ